ELRLITPTDPQERDAEGEPPRDEAGDRFYQLTHDYLISSLREWLTRKQKETRRGRAQLLLGERAASWREEGAKRHLPSWWEWADIQLLTRKQEWTPSHQKMMRRANRYYAVRSVLAALVVVAGVSWGVYLCRQHANFTAGLVDRLIEAQTEQVPNRI